MTGGAGFIGSHLTDRLLAEGYEVAVLDDLSLGKRDNVPSGALFVERSIIAPYDDLDQRLGKERYDVLFHVAALPRVQASIKDPEGSFRANVAGTMRMLEYARQRGIPRFVFSSSSSVYGDQPTLPLREGMDTRPLSPYAGQKEMGETLCGYYHKCYGLETIALRYFNVFGPRQSAEGGYACLIPKVIRACLRGESPELWGDGLHTRDFTFVDDVVAANIAAARTSNSDAFGTAYNIGAGQDYSVLHVIDTIQRSLGTSLELDRKPPVVEPPHTRADVSRARALLGWGPRVRFEEGMARTIDWFKEHHN